eukprot:12661863-Alexandrium_andersonii.AAC.1
MAEGDMEVAEVTQDFRRHAGARRVEVIQDVRRHAGARRVEARIRRNDGDVDVGAVQAPPTFPAWEAPPAERAWEKP